MIYLELRDSSYNFKGAVVINSPKLEAKELIENFKSSLEECNWLEDKTFENIIEIFINFAYYIDDSIGKASICICDNKYLPNPKIKGLLKTNKLFTSKPRNITFILDKTLALTYKKKSSVVVSEDDSYDQIENE